MVAGLVVVQVLVFQFWLARHLRVLSDVSAAGNLPEPAVSRLRAYDDRARLVRTLLGGVLVAGVLGAILYPGLGPGSRKLSLAVISIVSSLVFAAEMFQERRLLPKVTAGLPRSTVRIASLERRTFRQHYSPFWEVIPPGVFLATLAYTLWAIPRIPEASEIGARPTGSLWMPLVFQGAYVLLTLVLGLHLVYRRSVVPQRSRPFVGTPEQAVALDQTLRSLKMRALFMIKMSGVLMLALMQVKQVRLATSGEAEAWLTLAAWSMLIVMLVLFAGFLSRVSRARRQIVSQDSPS